MTKPVKNSSKDLPMIGLLTDFGIEDAYVGIMKSVILTVCPTIPVIDLCHSIAAQNVLSGAYILNTTAPYLPHGSIVVAVVDPGVGTNRRAIAVRTENCVLVGPDNGIFSLILKHQHAIEAVNLDNPDFYLKPVSPTFHGRDIFAPVGAHLACGAKFEDVGTHIELDSLIHLSGSDACFYRHDIEAHVLHIDRFGNVVTNLTKRGYEKWGGDPQHAVIEFEAYPPVRVYRTFADVPLYSPLAFWGSGGHLEIAVRDSNAAAHYGLAQASSVIVRPGQPVELYPNEPQ